MTVGKSAVRVLVIGVLVRDGWVLLEEYDGESIIEEGRKTLHISVPSKELDITVDKKQGGLQINAGERTTNEEGDSITSHSVEISVKQQ